MPPQSGTTDHPTPLMKYIKGIQDRPGWSIARVARESNGRISKATLFRMMTGDTKRASIEHLTLIAEIVGDDPDHVLSLVAGLSGTAESASGATGTFGDPRLEGLDPNDDVVRRIMAMDVDEETRGFMLDHRREILALRRAQDIRELELMARRNRGAA